MVQKAFAGDIAYDWELWIGREASPGAGSHTFIQIFGFETLPFPDKSPEDEDATHMQSPGRSREVTPGLTPVASWSQEKQLWVDDPGDLMLVTLASLTASGSKEDVIFEFNLKPDGSSIRYAYRGYVNNFTPTGTVGSKSMVNLGAKLLNEVPVTRVVA